MQLLCEDCEESFPAPVVDGVEVVDMTTLSILRGSVVRARALCPQCADGV